MWALLYCLSQICVFQSGHLKLLTRLEYPSDRLRVVFCEGDSTDQTQKRLNEFVKIFGERFSEIDILTHQTGNTLETSKRYLPKLQRIRRSRIAKVRNHMIQKALRPSDDWVLWLDADICDFSADILSRLIEAKRKIVTPNCVIIENGVSFDTNSFVTRNLNKDYRYYRAIKDGIYQPKLRINSRYHLSDLKHLSKVGLDGVGGTMLLVDASLHRAGLIFPE